MFNNADLLTKYKLRTENFTNLFTCNILRDLKLKIFTFNKHLKSNNIIINVAVTTEALQQCTRIRNNLQRIMRTCILTAEIK